MQTRDEVSTVMQNQDEVSTVLQTLDFVSGVHNCLESVLPAPLVFLSGYANTENVFYCLIQIVT